MATSVPLVTLRGMLNLDGAALCSTGNVGREQADSVVSRAGQPSGTAADALTAERTEQVRARVRRFTKVSHPRISSHHRDIDKKRYPDIGMHGQVVREKLHGRTAQGTWVQLEKTPAAFGKRKLPSLNDIRHLMDYVVYRVTRSNVGPWGLSHMTERRPIYLSPDLAVPTSLAPPVAESLAQTLRRISAADDTTAVSHDLASRFPPSQADPSNELGQALTGRAGRGLFGNSQVWVTETPPRSFAAVLGRLREQPRPAALWAEAGSS